MTATIEIQNDGPAITRTSYWRTPHARAGLLYLSVNAATLRMLVPSKIERALLSPTDGLPPVGRTVTLTDNTWQDRETYVLQWDEPADSGLEPYSIDIDREQCDRPITPEDIAIAGRVLPLVWYGQVGVWGVRVLRRELVQVGEVVAS